jgi:iron(II)-dependent oxidoreductase
MFKYKKMKTLIRNKLSKLNRIELLCIAEKLKINGRSRMKRRELIEVLQERSDVRKHIDLSLGDRIRSVLDQINRIAGIIGVIIGIIGVIIGIIGLLKMWEKEKYKEYVSEIESDMILIEAGGFLRGSSEEEIKQLINKYPDWRYEWFNDEIPQEKIYIDSFYISRFEITNKQYERFLMDNPNYKKPDYWNEENFNASNQPVVGVSWYDAVAFCNWLSEKTQKNYRLPTEAEWEKAARGADARIFPWGNAEPDIQKANFMEQYGKTISVKKLPAGASFFGVMHMAGNVWEWCSDWYDETYYKKFSGRYNPTGSLKGYLKVVRGGSWMDNAFYLRCASRYQYSPEIKRNNIGFRIVRIPDN